MKPQNIIECMSNFDGSALDGHLLKLLLAVLEAARVLSQHRFEATLVEAPMELAVPPLASKSQPSSCNALAKSTTPVLS